jgi:tetratricopeptide (TPR) repeat protein
VRSLIDEGAVVRGDGGFEATDKIDSVVIPPTVNDVLMARIDRLEEQTRELVKIASVIGRSFFDRIIKDVAASIADVDDRLAYLKDVQLIRDRTRMQELEYLFKHALAQEAAYESTLIQQRKALHLKVAKSIEKIFQDRLHEFYGMLAYHYSKGEDLEKAEEYMTRAGEEALRSSASSEALHYFQEALRLYLAKSGEEIDDEKIGIFEKYIALSFHAKGHYGIAVHYFDRVLHRWGSRSIRNRMHATIRLAGDLSIILARAFLPWEEGKQSPNSRELEVYDLKARLVGILVFVAPGRFFPESIAIARTGLRFDPDEVGSSLEPWLGLSGLFSVSGLSFSLSKKFLQRAEAAANKCGYRRPLLYKLIQAAYIHCSGKWNEIGMYDKTAVSEAARNGDLWDVFNYIWFIGIVAAEQGKFQDMHSLIDELFEIAEAYEHDFARVVHSLMRSVLLLRTAEAHEAAKEATSIASLAAKRGFLGSGALNLGLKSVAQVMSGDIAGAQECILRTQGLMDQQDRLAPVFKAPYLVGRLMLRIELLREAARSGHGGAMSKNLRMRYQIGREALRNAARYAPYRTWILKLMGDYYWLINKQGKAMKWWDRAIKEGERLGARPDLSRTYFEVGKRMLESQSKYKQLNGIDANGYLEKAGILFEEMGLEQDLEDLERVRMGL